MSGFDYSYDKLFGNKSQCEVCKNETCLDVGKHSHYDGKIHNCSRFKQYNKEREEEISREKLKKEQDEMKKYWDQQRKRYGL